MQTIPDIIKDALAKVDTQDDARDRACTYAFALGLIKVANEKREYLLRDQAATITRLSKVIAEMQHAALTALPFVEEAENDPAYKKGAVKKVTDTLLDAINDAEGALLATKPGEPL